MCFVGMRYFNLSQMGVEGRKRFVGAAVRAVSVKSAGGSYQYMIEFWRGDTTCRVRYQSKKILPNICNYIDQVVVDVEQTESSSVTIRFAGGMALKLLRGDDGSIEAQNA